MLEMKNVESKLWRERLKKPPAPYEIGKPQDPGVCEQTMATIGLRITYAVKDQNLVFSPSPACSVPSHV